MNAIRNIIDVKGKKIIINLPDNFESTKAEVIVLPYNEEEKSEKKENISNFFKNSPLYDSGINFDRNKDIGREINI